MRVVAVAVIVGLVCLGAHFSHAQDGMDFDYGDYSYPDDIDYLEHDDYGYYGNDDMQYYDYHGYYPDDYDGYNMYDDYGEFSDCSFNDKGKPVLLNGTTSCPLKIAGVDKQAGKLVGGIDGVYELVSCFNGKPMYRRKNTTQTAGESRVLWYSDAFGDWDISRGSEPNENEIIMYGGEREFATLPLLVSSWHLNAATKDSKLGAEDYVPVKVQLTCADGTKFDAKAKQKLEGLSESRQTTGPMLTDAEMDKKYKEIYEKFGKRPEPNPAVSFTFVVLLVMIGLTIVLAIPYFLVKKKTNGKASISTSFTQMLQQSKKKQSGHAN